MTEPVGGVVKAQQERCDLWPSGVGGVPCVDCNQITLCRHLDGDWRCRLCWEGHDDDED